MNNYNCDDEDIYDFDFDSGPTWPYGWASLVQKPFEPFALSKFIFSSQASDLSPMWLLIGLPFRPAVSVRKRWLGNRKETFHDIAH